MARTLDMRLIRYINLFKKVTGMRAEHCFSYNNIIIFVVTGDKMSRAIGENGKNVKKLSEILGKKVKIIASPKGRENIEEFISAIVHPVKFKNLDLQEDKVIINASKQSKASLIGRNKTRLNEMKNILGEYFGISEIKMI
jgi:NusA-like KH domain protein